MLTSKPPFQSATTDEIYRRARERDYEWPKSEASQKYISQEAKDLVASMLEDADRRPDPDDIVQHHFFVSGYFPAPSDITCKLRDLPPESADFYASRTTPQMQALALKNLKELCKDCGVGPWAQVQMIHTQIWKEVAAEEKAGLTPMIPLVDGMVYRPFDEWLKEQQKQQHQSRVLAPPPMYSTSTLEDTTSSIFSQKAPSGLLRAPPQSFAAQQRAQNRPVLPQTMVNARQPEAVPALGQSVRARPKRDTQPVEVRRDDPQLNQKIASVSLKAPLPSGKSLANLNGVVASLRPALEKDLDTVKPQIKTVKKTSLFSPSERPQEVPGTKPDMILDRLRRLQMELERALNTRTMAMVSPKDTKPPKPNVVIKWVDYTNKFGLGYILNDGSVGCILRDIPTTEGTQTALLPPACMLVRDAEEHIQRQQDITYAERHQLFPMSEAIQFYENIGESGLSCLQVSPESFRVPVKEDGTAGKLSPGKDVFEHRKRERLILWKKFANYMVAHGRDESIPGETVNDRGPGPKMINGQPTDVVTFYQRFGDVGCWVFCDGHLQVREPRIAGFYLATWLTFRTSSTSPTTRRSYSIQLGRGAISGICPKRQRSDSLLLDLWRQLLSTSDKLSRTPCRRCSTSSLSRL
jgi:hypothetical protein